MALCLLAPRGFQKPERDLTADYEPQSLTVSVVVMDQDWNQTGFWLSVKETVSEVVPEQWGRSACSTLQGFFFFFEAARRSGLDQNQVSEGTTTVWLCLHVESNPAPGWAVVDILFYVRRDTLTAK